VVLDFARIAIAKRTIAPPKMEKKPEIFVENPKSRKSSYEIKILNPIINKDISFIKVPPPKKNSNAIKRGRNIPPNIIIFKDPTLLLQIISVWGRPPSYTILSKSQFGFVLETKKCPPSWIVSTPIKIKFVNIIIKTK